MSLVEQSLEIQQRENETHPLVAATRMKLADLLMRTHKVDEAMYD
jgi:hypothetical protein